MDTKIVKEFLDVLDEFLGWEIPKGKPKPGKAVIKRKKRK